MKPTHKFSDLLSFIEEKRKKLFETNPLFKTLANDDLTVEQKMLFVPYMLFFSCSGPDVITAFLRKKEDEHLSYLEKKINAFIAEDNFHYNFYLKDLETLGYTLEKFGSVQGLIRHIYAEEAIPVRKLVYSLSAYSQAPADPLVRLTICELIEAGLFDLFVTIYKKIVKKKDSPFAHLHYFGDTHVQLEMNHSVTTWFSGNTSEISTMEVSSHLMPFLKQMIEEIMEHFHEMYLAFNKIILKGETIFPEKYQISNTPPINQITNKNYVEAQ